MRRGGRRPDREATLAETPNVFGCDTNGASARKSAIPFRNDSRRAWSFPMMPLPEGSVPGGAWKIHACSTFPSARSRGS